MKKIATNHDFQRELFKVLAMCQGPKRPSRDRLAAKLRGMANRLQGRTANLTDDDTLEQLIDMEMESLGIEGHPTYEDTSKVESLASRFEDVVEKALTSWVTDNIDEGKLTIGQRGPLDRVRFVRDVVAIMMDLRGGAAYLYFMEHEGHGVGTWDGGWDKLFTNPKQSLKDLSRFVLSKTRGPYGQLKDAITEAAMNAGDEF